MALQLFWLVATIDVVVSIGFVLRVRTRGNPTLDTDRTDTLINSLRKDTWAACAIIWAVLLSDGCPIRWVLCVTGAVALAWLLQRAVRRFRVLR